MTDTRSEAHAGVRNRKVHARERCLRALQHSRPRSADEIAADLGESVLFIRPRITELRRDGLIEDAGTRSINVSGKPAKQWRLAS